jgi:broad specificity phosphatase PhoE
MDSVDPGSAAFTAATTGRREPGVPPEDGRVRLVLVRHGRTPSNVAHRLDTALPGPSLDEVGAAQADEVAELLADWPVRAVHASVAARARETAAPIAARHGMAVSVLEGVHEISVGDLDGRSDDEAKTIFDEVFRSWWDGDTARPQPGGDSADTLRARFLPDVDRALGGVTGGAVVIVSHGAAIRLAMSALLAGRDGATWARDNLVPNTGRIVLRADPDGWTLERHDPMPGG